MIPFVDLRAQHAPLQTELLEAIGRVLERCEFTLGDEVAAFETEFAAYTQTRHCVAVSRGTSALHLALLAADVGPGDEVITVPHTFIATASAIRYTGASPVFVDIDPVSYTMDPRLIERAITPRTRAILPVHLYGQPADMDPIVAVARTHRLTVIEDACQAHGAEYKGRRAGSLGDMAAFSFYPSKNLGACGEGGALVSSNPDLVQKVRMLRDWGQDRRHHHVLEGFNYRLDNIQGAVLRVKLRYLDAWNAARRRHAARYQELLQEASVRIPTEMPYAKHVYHVYPVLSARRKELHQRLSDRGVATSFHYPTPVHLQPCFAHLGYQAGQFPHAEKAAAEEISLPMYAEMTEAMLQVVAAAVKEELAPREPEGCSQGMHARVGRSQSLIPS